MKSFVFALLFAFGLSKIGAIDKQWIETKIAYNQGNEQSLIILKTVDNFYTSINLYSLKPIEIIPEIKGFNGTISIVNYLITYTPIFWIFTFLFGKFFGKHFRKNPAKTIPENIRIYLDFELERMYQKKLREEVVKEVHKELLRLQQSRVQKQNKVA